MANHLSALKRARQTERRTVRNRSNTSTLRTQLRDLRETIEKGDKAAAEQS
ncbi:MAG: 30S ribosomal protein S20, partial [Candidatus Sulfotelmatobacter sp.]